MSFSLGVVYRERFDIIYNSIPEDCLKICGGAGQITGIGIVEKKLLGFIINYVPSQADYRIEILRRPGLMGSSPDGNSRLGNFFPRMIKWILATGPILNDEAMRKLFKRIYAALSKLDNTVSPCGDLVILRPSGEAVELSF